MSNEIDYGAVLADMQKRREDLDRGIAAICAIMGVPVPPSNGGGPSGPEGRTDTTKDIRSDTFFNMKAPEAVKTYLGMVKRPQTVREIQDALTAGGFASRAKDLYNNLYTAILRMEENDTVVKVHGKWGLSDWYPARPKPKAKTEAAAKGEPLEPSEVEDEEETAA